MYPHDRLIDHGFHIRRAFAVAALVLGGLAACASDPALTNHPPSDAAPYVGAFTGEFVDGKPLYRLPSIEIVGSRSSLGAGS
jgi:hypothetical protein